MYALTDNVVGRTVLKHRMAAPRIVIFVMATWCFLDRDSEDVTIVFLKFDHSLGSTPGTTPVADFDRGAPSFFDHDFTLFYCKIQARIR